MIGLADFSRLNGQIPFGREVRVSMNCLSKPKPSFFRHHDIIDLVNCNWFNSFQAESCSPVIIPVADPGHNAHPPAALISWTDLWHRSTVRLLVGPWPLLPQVAACVSVMALPGLTSHARHVHSIIIKTRPQGAHDFQVTEAAYRAVKTRSHLAAAFEMLSENWNRLNYVSIRLKAACSKGWTSDYHLRADRRGPRHSSPILHLSTPISEHCVPKKSSGWKGEWSIQMTINPDLYSSLTDKIIPFQRRFD
jgi:hypothetical protein